jgi:hypothetical protein
MGAKTQAAIRAFAADNGLASNGDITDAILAGTVNLPTGSCAKTGRYPLALRGYTQFGDLAPRDHRLRTKRSIVR